MGNTAEVTSNRQTRRHTGKQTATVMPLPTSARNHNLDFWVQVIMSENPNFVDPVLVRQRLLATIEHSILDDTLPDQATCGALGVPTFIELVLANPTAFAEPVVRKARRQGQH